MLLLGKLLSDPDHLPAVQQAHERMKALGTIAKAAYLMGFKDCLVLVLILLGLYWLLFILPASLARRQETAPGDDSSPLS